MFYCTTTKNFNPPRLSPALFAGPEFQYQPGDWLLFGAETTGLPPEAHSDILAAGGALVKVPITTTHVRSLNLAVGDV